MLLPRAKAAIPKPEHPSQESFRKPIPEGNERTLFVDDEKAVCRSIKHILTYLGYKVLTVESGQEALRVFGGSPNDFDLIITDYAMPGLTGIELSKAIQSIRPDIPIILCTAFHGITAEEAEAAGICEVAFKPIVMSELAEVIRRVLDRRSR